MREKAQDNFEVSGPGRASATFRPAETPPLDRHDHSYIPFGSSEMLQAHLRTLWCFMAPIFADIVPDYNLMQTLSGNLVTNGPGYSSDFSQAWSPKARPQDYKTILNSNGDSLLCASKRSHSHDSAMILTSIKSLRGDKRFYLPLELQHSLHLHSSVFSTLFQQHLDITTLLDKSQSPICSSSRS